MDRAISRASAPIRSTYGKRDEALVGTVHREDLLVREVKEQAHPGLLGRGSLGSGAPGSGAPCSGSSAAAR